MVGHAARGCARTAVVAQRRPCRHRGPIGCRGICQRFQSFEFEAMARWRRRRAVGTLFARDGSGKPNRLAALSASRGSDSILESPRVRADVSFTTRSTRHRDRERGVRFLRSIGTPPQRLDRRSPRPDPHHEPIDCMSPQAIRRLPSSVRKSSRRSDMELRQ